MLTPYDWQESIGNRAQYIEDRLEQGLPVLAVSLDEGILLFAYRRRSPKIYEIYDRLAFAAVGQQSDIEALRLGAVDFAHQEGYNRSEQDVTIHRVVAGLSSPLKRAFADFSVSPVVARSLFAEVGESADTDAYFTLDFDGDYSTSSRCAALSGNVEQMSDVRVKLEEIDATTSPADALLALRHIWDEALPDIAKDDLEPEAVLLERSDLHVNRFRRITPES